MDSTDPSGEKRMDGFMDFLKEGLSFAKKHVVPHVAPVLIGALGKLMGGGKGEGEGEGEGPEQVLKSE